MFYLNSKRSKSGHPKMQNPIMLCLKAKGIRTAPPGNSYILYKKYGYLNFSGRKKKWQNEKQNK